MCFEKLVLVSTYVCQTNVIFFLKDKIIFNYQYNYYIVFYAIFMRFRFRRNP